MGASVGDGHDEPFRNSSVLTGPDREALATAPKPRSDLHYRVLPTDAVYACGRGTRLRKSVSLASKQ